MPRKIVLGVLFFLIPFEPSDAQSGPAKSTSQFSISLEAPHSQAKAGSPLVVRIFLTNLTDQGFLMDADKGNRGEFDYTIRVLDKDGQEPSRSRYFRAVRGEDTFDPASKTQLIVSRGIVPRAIEPHGVYEDDIDLNELYVLSPGNYTVQVGLGAIQDLSKTVWKSKKIIVTVTP